MALKIAKAAPRENSIEAAQRAFADGNLDRAAELFLAVLETDPDNAAVFMQVGVIFYQQEKYDKAVFALRRAIELAPHLVDAYNAMGVVMFRLNWYAASEVFFRWVVEHAPDHATARQSLIEAMHMVRETSDAIDEGLLPIVKLARPAEARLSLCMIVKNEEQFLEGCLESAQGVVDEMIIVDTGSSDGTVAIAERFGARVFHTPWDGDFSAARNESINHASGDWILVLDADERLDEGSKLKLSAMMRNTEAVGYSLMIENRLGDGEGPAAQMATVFRMFRNRPDVRFEGIIHEQAIVTAQATGLKTLPCNVKITHLGYLQTWMDSRDKLTRNLEILERQQEGEPENPFVYYNLGQTLKMMGRHEEAERNYREALKLLKAQGANPKIPYYANLYFSLGDLYRQMRRYDDAHATLDDGIAIYPDFPDLIYTKGFAFMDAEHFPEAIAEFQRCQQFRGVLHAGGTDPAICGYKGLNAIGVCYAKQGDSKNAKDYLRRALAEHPRPDAELMANLGILHMQDNEFTEAVDWFTKAIERDPHERRAWVNLAGLSMRLGRPREAAEAWEKILEFDPDMPGARLFCIEALLRSGQAEKAGPILAAVVDLHPEARETWLNMGLAHLIAGRDSDAVAAWERFGADPECASLVALARVLEGGKAEFSASSEDAIRTWGAAFDMLLANAQADRLQIILDRLDELGSALRGLEMALARVLQRHGMADLAGQLLATSLSRYQDDAAFFMLLGEICMEQGQAPDARSMFHRVLELDPASSGTRALLAKLDAR